MVLQLGHVDSLCSLASLWTSLWCDAQIRFGDDESMVSPTLCSTHGIGYSDILPVFFSDNDVVDEMPVFRPGMHQG